MVVIILVVSSSPLSVTAWTNVPSPHEFRPCPEQGSDGTLRESLHVGLAKTFDRIQHSNYRGHILANIFDSLR